MNSSGRRLGVPQAVLRLHGETAPYAVTSLLAFIFPQPSEARCDNNMLRKTREKKRGNNMQSLKLYIHRVHVQQALPYYLSSPFGGCARARYTGDAT